MHNSLRPHNLAQVDLFAATTTPTRGGARAAPANVTGSARQKIPGARFAPAASAWQHAAASLPQDQVALLLRSVGLPATATSPAPAKVE
jgi:hypothetical protein